MRWTKPLILAMAGLLLFAAEAFGVRSGGHNPPTRKLEVAFKVLGGYRAQSEDGCYPSPGRGAKLIDVWSRVDAHVAPNFNSLERVNQVYVIRRRSSCERVVMALRARGKVYVLDTSGGEVFVKGAPNRLDDETRRGGRGPLRALTTIGRSFELRTPDRVKRLTVRCPRGRFPLGGGMTSSPAVGHDGEGVYPHSYERLGTQRAFHISALLIDPSPAETTPRSASIQVVCGKGLVPKSSPHTTVFVRRNQTNTAVARCPRGQYLFSGGFQRTNFTTPYLTYGGNFVTESRAISPQAWQVTGHAVGWDGGELTAIAHCARNDGPFFTEVSAFAAVPGGQPATATTPPCPEGLSLTAGGFSFNGSQDAFFAGGSFNPDGSWSATGFGFLGPAEALTAYGYCLQPADS
jgi:hypothetical protein